MSVAIRDAAGLVPPPADARDGCWRDAEGGHVWGGAAQRRNHSIWIEPLGAGRRYTDRIDIDAGWLTAIVAGFAALSDRTPAKKRRWRRLARRHLTAPVEPRWRPRLDGRPGRLTSLRCEWPTRGASPLSGESASRGDPLGWRRLPTADARRRCQAAGSKSDFDPVRHTVHRVRAEEKSLGPATRSKQVSARTEVQRSVR